MQACDQNARWLELGTHQPSADTLSQRSLPPVHEFCVKVRQLIVPTLPRVISDRLPFILGFTYLDLQFDLEVQIWR